MGKVALVRRFGRPIPYHVGMSKASSTRQRPGYDQALSRVLARVVRLETEPVPLAGALGCVLAEPIVADRDQPPFDRSTMDGYAVRSTQIAGGAEFNVVATISAGAAVDTTIDLTQGVAAIATGAGVPDAYDAVIPIEQAEEQTGRVRFGVSQVTPGAYIHARGSDAVMGRVLIEPGELLGPQHIGIAAAVGRVQPVVTRKPGVSLITTGDEVKPPASTTTDLESQQVRNANGPMLEAFLQSLGVERLDHVHVNDDREVTLSALREAVDKSDLVITVGGVSVGARDYLPWAAGELGFETIVKGAAIQPGKPIFVAQAGDGSGRLIVGLPGNPVSMLATAHLFAWPIIRAMTGRDPGLPWRRVELIEAVDPNPQREAFRCAKLNSENRGRARVIGWQNSGDLSHTSRADGFVRLPAQADAVTPGQSVPFLPMIGRTP
jgi:molybdopterin molybdotransferase